MERPHWIPQETINKNPYYERTVLAASEIPFRHNFKEKFSREFLHLLRKKRFDIIVMNFGLPSTLVYSVYARLMSSKIINHNTVHSSHVDLLTILNDMVSRVSILFSSEFITLTGYHRDFLMTKGVASKKIHLISHSINPNEFIALEEDSKMLKKELALSNKRIVLFVGRLEKEKGIDYLIKAMKTVLAFEKNAHLLIIGSGVAGSYLKTLVKQLNLTEHVDFLGSIPSNKMNLYYAICDIHAAPSIKTKTFVEPFGMVFLEAMASGKPSIAFDIPAPVREIIKNGETGYLVTEKNILELAGRIVELLRNDTKRTEMGKAAKKRALEFYDMRTIAKKWIEAFDEAAKEKSQPLICPEKQSNPSKSEQCRPRD